MAWCSTMVDTLRVSEVATQWSVQPMCVSWCTLSHPHNVITTGVQCTCGDTFRQLSSDAPLAQMWMATNSGLDTTMPNMMKVNPVLLPIVCCPCWPFDNPRFLQSSSFPHTPPSLDRDHTLTAPATGDPAVATGGRVEAMEARAEVRGPGAASGTSLTGCSSTSWTPSWSVWATWGRTWSSSSATPPPSSWSGRAWPGERADGQINETR